MIQIIMIYNLIFSLLSLSSTIFVFYYLSKINKELNAISKAIDIKSVKLDIIENLLILGIYVTDEKGKWTYVNNTMASMFSMQPAEMIGNGWLRNVENRDQIYAKWILCIEQQLPYSDIITVRLDNRKCQFEISTLPILTDGKFSAFVGTIKPFSQSQQQI